MRRPRPETTWGTTEKIEIGCGKMWVTVNEDKKGLCEVFCEVGKYGGCKGQTEAIGRLISLCLMSDVPVKDIIDQLESIRCPAAARNRKPSCPDAIADALSHRLKNKVKICEKKKQKKH